MSKHWLLPIFCFAMLACSRQAPVESGALYGGDTATSGDRGIDPAADVAITPGSVQDDTEQVDTEQAGDAPTDESAVVDPQAPAETDWSPMELDSGKAWVSCEHDYAAMGDGEPLLALDADSVREALLPCQERGTLRLRYKGKIAADFSALIERVIDIADELGIDSRVLDIDSTGGRIEEAILAGDAIAESGWTIWVREDAICHSSCVLVLAAGDMRLIAGKTGVHRMVRIDSEATSRAELDRELRDIYQQVKEYLQRNGASVAVADLMMTVPNRSLRLLTDDELRRFGLEGRNAAEDDLQRIELARRCGEDFVRRKDGFYRAFERECTQHDEIVTDMNACGLGLRERFGFPDETCPDESPLADYDAATVDEPSPVPAGETGLPDV